MYVSLTSVSTSKNISDKDLSKLFFFYENKPSKYLDRKVLEISNCPLAPMS